jgi:hypothetical protein
VNRYYGVVGVEFVPIMSPGFCRAARAQRFRSLPA